MLLAVLAHEKLLHLEPTCVPPGDAHQKRIRPGPAGWPGRLRIKEQPLSRIDNFRWRIRRQQPQRPRIKFTFRRTGAGFAAGSLRKPPSQSQMLAEIISMRRGAEQIRKP